MKECRNQQRVFFPFESIGHFSAKGLQQSRTVVPIVQQLGSFDQ